MIQPSVPHSVSQIVNRKSEIVNSVSGLGRAPGEGTGLHLCEGPCFNVEGVVFHPHLPRPVCDDNPTTRRFHKVGDNARSYTPATLTCYLSLLELPGSLAFKRLSHSAINCQPKISVGSRLWQTAKIRLRQ